MPDGKGWKMSRYASFLAVLAGVLSFFSVPQSASAQFFRANPFAFRQFGGVNPVYNTLQAGYLNNTLAARSFYTNAYLNRAVGNVFNTNARLTGGLYNNALITNALLGNTNSATVNTLAS